MTYIEGIWNEVLNFEFTSWAGLWLYWIPLVLCAVYFSIKCMLDYYSDAKNRAGSIQTSMYIPRLKIGTIVNRAIASVCPVINLWEAVFDAFPFFMGHIGTWIEKLLDVPLVPDSTTHKKLREEKYNNASRGK